MPSAIERVHLTVFAVTHAPAQTEDAGALKRGVVQAVRDGGDFIDTVLDGGQRLSFLTTSTIRVVVTMATTVLDGESADRGSTSWRAAFTRPIRSRARTT